MNEEYNQLVKMANEVHRNTMLMEHFYLPIPDERKEYRRQRAERQLEQKYAEYMQ